MERRGLDGGREGGSIPSKGMQSARQTTWGTGSELLTHKIAFNSTSLNVNMVVAIGHSSITYHFTESCSCLGGNHVAWLINSPLENMGQCW